MDEQEQARERERKFLQDNPEVELKLTSLAAEMMEELGMETSPEQISEFVLDLSTEFRQRAKHHVYPLFTEVVTDEEVKRATDEEFDRLYDPEIGGVDIEELEAAIVARLWQKFKGIYPHLPGE